MVQLTSEVNNIATISTRNNARAIDDIPRKFTRKRKTIKAMKTDTMNTSPWAKFTMPMMPNTIV